MKGMSACLEILLVIYLLAHVCKYTGRHSTDISYWIAIVVYVFGDIQNFTEKGPGKPALTDLFDL